MSIDIAEHLGAEVISVDSMMVYRDMDVGTAKPTVIERRGILHHLIDLVEPEEEFTVAEFRGLGRAVIERADVPLIIVGGSGLHFRALVDPMSFAPTDPAVRGELEKRPTADLVAELNSVDAEAGAHVDLSNRRRLVRALEILRLTGETPSYRAGTAEAEALRRYVPELDFVALGVDPGEGLDGRIDKRLGEMRSGGLVEEVTRLRNRLGRTARAAVGYRELLDHLDGRLSLDEAFAAAGANTRRLARRQRTWFQRDPRIRWIPWMESRPDRVERALEVFS